MKARRDSIRRRVVFGALILLAVGCAQPSRSTPRVRLVLVEHHWSGWGGGPYPPDTTVVEAAVGDSLGKTWGHCDGKKPLVLVGVLPGGEALVRYAECLNYLRSDSLYGGGPIGPETLAVRSTWAHLSTHVTDGGVEYSIRLLAPGPTGAQPSGLWHDRYSEDFPALGDRVELDERPEVLSRTQPRCPDRLASRGMRLVGMMWVLVSKQGTVLATRSFDSDSLVVASTDECVRQWTYRPGRWQGKPVASWLSVDVEICPSPPRVRR